jgi:hypothetical protein
MNIGHDEMQMFELFAMACDQLNDYARTLRSPGRFFDVRTGTGIRNYQAAGVSKNGSKQTFIREASPREGSALCGGWS